VIRTLRRIDVLKSQARLSVGAHLKEEKEKLVADRTHLISALLVARKQAHGFPISGIARQTE
jgi:hypothetical protein